MQRKGSVVRPAFTLMSALFLMIIIATIASFSLQNTTKTLTNTQTLFIQEQMELLAQSAVEIALLRKSADKTLEHLELSYLDAYEIQVDLKEISGITTEQSLGTVVCDVWVKYSGTPSLCFHRRTLQKP